MADFRLIAAVLVIAGLLTDYVESAQYLGKFLGKLSELHHGVSGEIYAVDGRTLHIKDFTYDGQGPAAYFYASNSRTPSNAGFRLRDENGSGDVIRRYRKEGVTITLPEGKSLNNIKIFYVWCEEFEVNFGDVKIPRGFEFPRPVKVEPLKGVHAISSDNIVIVDAQTLLIPNLSFDGEAPDAKFWVGRGPKPSPQGIRVPDENGKELPLKRYDRKTIVLTLPGDLTVFDIGHFGIWCEAFTVDFGHIQIPQNLNIPPSLKMLGVSPQSKLNCEVLYDDLAFEVRWAVAGESIVLQLVAKLDEREYMAFGLSGDSSKSVMEGGDVVVAWIDRETSKGFVEDYFLDSKSQCSGPKGSCPDDKLATNTNSARLLNAAMVNGYSIVTYQRPLKASDELDKPIFTNQSQAVIWAIGPLNQRDEVSFHSQFTKGNHFLDFGRPAKWNCPMPENEQPPMKPVSSVKEEVVKATELTTIEPETTSIQPTRKRIVERRRGGGGSKRQEVGKEEEKSATEVTSRRQQGERRGTTRGQPKENVVARKIIPTPAPVKDRDAWDIPPIQCYEPEDGVFYAQMGPTGGKRGYPAITGHVGWGISWYINGLLIPEIYLVRGKTYTFVVEGGVDPDVPAKYHPFYITDDPIGGYEYKTTEEKSKVKIFAGARKAKDGTVYPTGVGRLCHWTHQGDSDADDFESFGAYQRTLELKCDQGEPGVIQWTPDEDTPDTVYYQCFTHRYLGWKIHVVDSCDTQAAGSDPEPAYALPDPLEHHVDGEDLESSASIQVETRVKPNAIEAEPDKPQIETEEPEYATIQYTVPNRQENIQRRPGNFQFQHFYRKKGQQNYFPIEKHMTERISAEEAAKLMKVDNSHLPSIRMPPNKILVRRPHQPVPVMLLNNPYIPQKPMKTLIRPINYQIQRPQEQTILKKPYYMPMVKGPLARPVRMPYPVTPDQLQLGGHGLIFLQPPPNGYSHNLKKTPKTPVGENTEASSNLNEKKVLYSQSKLKKPVPTKQPIVQPTPSVSNVEISPQQASTEKEPDIQTAKYSPLVITKPDDEYYQKFKIPLARNTGFRPESVVVEGGFKPILSKEIQDRMGEGGPELEYESEVGVIPIQDRENMEQAVEKFDPIFVPSPLDKPSSSSVPKKIKKKTHFMIIIKEGRKMNNEDDDSDEVAEAAERVEAFYLPPPGQRVLKPMEEVSNKPSDLDVPPGTVVTYDGRKVSGASLTAKLADRSSILTTRASKAAELIKATPQFAPYKGELPPLDPRFVNTDIPQLRSQGTLRRDLDAPLSGPTRLERIQQISNENLRRKREAHHTPEHTAEQQRLKNQKSSATAIRAMAITYTALLLCLAKIF